MTAGQPVSRTAADGSLANLEVALRDLGFAVKSLQLYPSTSPVVEGAIERSYRSFAPLLSFDALHLEITPGMIRIGAHELGAEAPVVGDLARRMHGRGLARLHLDRRLRPESLQALSEILATDPRGLDELGGIERVFRERRMGGIAAEFLELERLFAEEDGAETEDIWEAILRGYHEANDDVDENIDWNALVRSVDRLQDFISWLAKNLDAVADRTGYENIDVMRFTMDRLGSISASLTAEHVNFLVLAVRQAFDDFDPEVLVELLADPMEIELGGDEPSTVAEAGEYLDGPPGASHRRTIDIGSYIAGGLEPEQAETLILHALRTQQRSSPRLYGLFERLTRNRSERPEMANNVEKTLEDEVARGEASSDFLANWPRLVEVLNGEAPRRFLTAEYDAGLQKLLTPARLENAWPIEQVTPRLSEMSPSFIGLRKSLMVGRLLNHDIGDDDYKRLALELESALERLVQEHQFRTVHKLLKELIEVAEDEDRSQTRREIAAGVVERLYTAETVHFLVSASIGRPHEEVELIMNTIRMRGTHVVPLLLDILAVEEERRVRQRLLRLLPDLGDAVGHIVVERFGDDRWYVLRNLAMVLGEVGEPAMAAHLAPLFNHADQRVRQEAIASTIKLGGPNAAELLLDALDDTDPTAYVMAIHGLGYHGNEEAKSRLRKLLGSANLWGQTTHLIKVSAIALGRLQDEKSRPRLRRLARRPWLFRGRRVAAQEAAAWALQALDGEPPGKAPDLGAFADLRPGAGALRLRAKG